MEILQTRVAQAEPARGRHERALIEAWNAVQWLARVARSYASSSGQDGALHFDPATGRAITSQIAPGIRLGLHLPRLVFQFEEDGQPTPHALDVDDKSTAEVEAWLLAELLHRGFDRDRFDKRLPYEWPHPMSGDEIKYAAHDLARELDRLTRQLAEAATCLIEAKKILEAERGAVPSRSAAMTFSPRSFGINLALASAGRVEAFLAPHEDAVRIVYRVTDEAGRTLGAEIATSAEAPSHEVVAREIVDAIERLESQESKHLD